MTEVELSNVTCHSYAYGIPNGIFIPHYNICAYFFISSSTSILCFAFRPLFVGLIQFSHSVIKMFLSLTIYIFIKYNVHHKRSEIRTKRIIFHSIPCIHSIFGHEYYSPTKKVLRFQSNKRTQHHQQRERKTA